MLAKNNEYLEEAAASIYRANAEEIVRQQCLAREDAERRERTLVRDNKLLKKEKAALKKENAALQENYATIQKSNAALQENYDAIQEEVAALKARILELEKVSPAKTD